MWAENALARTIAAERLVPAQCVIGFAVPVTSAEFRSQVEDARHKYARQVSTNERGYRGAVLNNFNAIVPALRATGVRVATGFTLADFTAALSDPKRPVVILVAHWTGAAIEFADGLVPLDTVVAAVPNEFDGILDLCVCHPDNLISRLRAERLNIGLIAWISTEALFQIWLYFYLALFKAMTERSRTYLEALDATTSQFFATARRFGG